MVSNTTALEQNTQSDASHKAKSKFPIPKRLSRFLARRRESKTPSSSPIDPAVVTAAPTAANEVPAEEATDLVTEEGNITEGTSQARHKAAPTVALDTSSIPDILSLPCNDKTRRFERDVVRSEDVKVQAGKRHALRIRAGRAMAVQDEAWGIPQIVPETYEEPMEAPVNTVKEKTTVDPTGPQPITSSRPNPMQDRSGTTSTRETALTSRRGKTAAPIKEITKLPPDVKVALPQVLLRSLQGPRPEITRPTPTHAEIESGAPSVEIWLDQVLARYPGLSDAIASKDHINLTVALEILRKLNRRKPWIHLGPLFSTSTKLDVAKGPGFPFLSLPFELRNQIYLDYFEDLLADKPCFNLNTLPPPPITKVSRDLRHESSAVLISKFPFSICYTIVPPKKRIITSCIFALTPRPSLKVLHPCTTAWIQSLPPSARKIRDLRVVCTKRPLVPVLFHLNTHAGQTKLQPWNATYTYNGHTLPLLPIIAHPDGQWRVDSYGKVKTFEAPGGVVYGYGRRWRDFEAEDLEERLRGVVKTLVQGGGVGIAELEGVGVGVRAVCEADPRDVVVLEGVAP